MTAEGVGLLDVEAVASASLESESESLSTKSKSHSRSLYNSAENLCLVPTHPRKKVELGMRFFGWYLSRPCSDSSCWWFRDAGECIRSIPRIKKVGLGAWRGGRGVDPNIIVVGGSHKQGPVGSLEI